jgi:CheY-like chemotaxis protein/Flp pilus assembly protein TadD
VIDVQEMKVLIVDDVVSMTKSLHNMMKVLGFGSEYFMANTGEEAWNIIQEEEIDLILLDLNLPGINGAELLSRIREDRILRDLPVIMVTGEAYQDYVAEAGESEIDSYVLKPVTIKLLEERVLQVIEKVNDPPPMIYHLKRARSFEEEGDIDSAIMEARLAMDSNPNVTRPIRELGYYYFLKEDYDEAEKWLLKASKLNHLDVFAFHYLGELYLKFDDINSAAHYFEKAMRISPRHLDRGVNFGKTLIKMGIEKKAAEVFEKVFTLSTSSLDLEEEIANFCIDEGVNEYASRLLIRVIKSKPERSDLMFKLGETFEKMGKFKKAIPYLVKAGEIDRENINIRIHLAKDYLAIDKPIMAEGPLKEILKTSPDNELARELLKQCV